MKEIIGNIWDQEDADAICITTNRDISSKGRLIMGAGIAREARDKFPEIDMILGSLVREYGNQPYVVDPGLILNPPKYLLISFPTKNHFRDDSDIKLIKRSAEILVTLIKITEERKEQWKRIIIPRPGCGLGNLKWEDVRKVLKPILDDRFYIITNE